MEQAQGSVTAEQHRRATLSTVPRVILAALLAAGVFAAMLKLEPEVNALMALPLLACFGYVGATAMATFLYLMHDRRGAPILFMAPGERVIRELFVKDGPTFGRFVLREVIR